MHISLLVQPILSSKSKYICLHGGNGQHSRYMEKSNIDQGRRKQDSNMMRSVRNGFGYHEMGLLGIYNIYGNIGTEPRENRRYTIKAYRKGENTRKRKSK